MATQLQWFDWLGLGGVAAILIAQLLVQIGAWRGDHVVFQLTNLLGALCTVFSLVYTLNITLFVALAIAWALVSGIGLYVGIGRRRAREEAARSGAPAQATRVTPEPEVPPPAAADPVRSRQPPF